MPRRLTVLAGSGTLVPHVVAAALAAGEKVQVLALVPRPDLPGVKVVSADLRNPLAILWHLKTFRTTHIVMAGGISLGDTARQGLLQFMRQKGGQASGTGDVALSGIAGTLKSLTGADVVGVQDIAPDLIAEDGVIAGPSGNSISEDDLQFALRLARGAGALDVGQAAVSSGTRPVAIEDVGGTDDLLARVCEHRRAGRIGDAGALLILAKAKKPHQPLTVDLPAIGPETLRRAVEAGITAIVVEAGYSLVLERAKVKAVALELGIPVFGRVLQGG